jgi:acyl-CoA reductase-like NAD-dependent aldehyde dehydrogenase
MLSSAASFSNFKYGLMMILHPTATSSFALSVPVRSFYSSSSLSSSLSSTRSTTTAMYTTISDSLAVLLKDETLLVGQSSTSSGSTNSDINDSSFPVYDPASSSTSFPSSKQQSEQQPIARVSITSNPKDVIQRCYDALPHWRDSTTASYRSSLLKEWSNHIQTNLDDLSIIMTMESGKPLIESRNEILYATSFLDYYAGEAIRSTGAGGGFMVPTPFVSTSTTTTTITTTAAPAGGTMTTATTTAPTPPATSPKGHIMAIQQAVGVAALIVPWNFPMAMITRKVGPALAAGCTAIVKPSDLTPLSAIALQNLAIRAGIPRGVFELV